MLSTSRFQKTVNPRRCRRGSAANAVLIALLFVCGVALALRFGQPNTVRYTAEPRASDGERPTAGAALGTFTVKDVAGHAVPLVTIGEPAIIMVSSRTCSWCRRTLADLGKMAAGRALPRLKLITLEGADEGTPMVAQEKLTGVQLLGPNGNAEAVFMMFRYPGTPTFLAVGRDGRVVETMPGYPDRDTLKRWFSVMVGDSDVP